MTESNDTCDFCSEPSTTSFSYGGCVAFCCATHLSELLAEREALRKTARVRVVRNLKEMRRN